MIDATGLVESSINTPVLNALFRFAFTLDPTGLVESFRDTPALTVLFWFSLAAIFAAFIEELKFPGLRLSKSPNWPLLLIGLFFVAFTLFIELGRSPSSMSTAQPELDTVQPELDATQPELDTAQPEPDTAQPEPDGLRPNQVVEKYYRLVVDEKTRAESRDLFHTEFLQRNGSPSGNFWARIERVDHRVMGVDEIGNDVIIESFIRYYPVARPPVCEKRKMMVRRDSEKSRQWRIYNPGDNNREPIYSEPNCN